MAVLNTHTDRGEGPLWATLTVSYGSTAVCRCDSLSSAKSGR